VLGRKRAGNLNAEIDHHRRVTIGVMMIEKDIVTVRAAKLRMGLQERPDPVQRRHGDPPDFAKARRASNGREHTGRRRFSGYGVFHESLPSPLKPARLPSPSNISTSRPWKSVKL